MKAKAVAGYDLVSAEASSRLDVWPERSKHLFTELLEDAANDMQRELLNRAVAAGHSAAEVHAFADALRGLSDVEAFEKCTIGLDSAPGYTVAQVLKAEADPLFAFTLRGGDISPAEERPRASDALPYVPPPSSPRSDGRKFDEMTDPKVRVQRSGGFDVRDDGALKRAAAAAARELGASIDAVPRPSTGPSAAVPSPSSGPAIVQDVLNDAMHALGIAYREQGVDGAGQAKLEDVMAQVAQALQRGLPVPVALGPDPGKDRRFALFLQVQTSGKSRAYQLYDVLSQEVAWLNEGDLFARTELPFASKANRRITRIALPVIKGS
ncbi:MAG: hypothetical protein JNK82_10155 [Myxococcaceae bacterium]|nr:hypothetical protein [Myxococcaceae bacterium]